ncbi:MAG: ATP-binding cassette domain-containing protein [Eubacteriales bacterium]
MLKLKDIRKDYVMGDTVVHALKGIDIEFRENEFVSILGQSGCGKTTLLNIIGGLDKYTSGDLIINGKSTKQFTDGDWDTYRNHSIGFIFQSYNLIPHQTVLSNVELALTLSGVSPEERKKRATEALNRVGLGDQLNKKPNQMSGGQMQRVAIARALVNDPDIILADEPTGALDSETSVQIMEILKEIAKEKLIIMVTHNPELAKQYSTRIIRLLDGTVTDDTDPYVSEDEKKPTKEKKKKKSMSFFTALFLSLNNLMTKKGRTFLTAFAGSIGIIGIALILSVSSGVNAYIDSIERSAMASYPLVIRESTMDTTTLLTSLMKENTSDGERDKNKVYSNDVMISMMKAMTSGMTTNNLTKFMDFLKNGNSNINDYTADIKYSYKANLNTYSVINNSDGTVTYRKNMSGFDELMEEIGMGGVMGSMMSGSGAWQELIGDSNYIKSQYTVVDGRLPEKSDEIVLIVDSNNQVSDYILYMLGIRDIQEIKDYIEAAKEAINNGTENTATIDPTEYTFEDLYGYTFKALLDSDYYKLDGEKIVERTDEEIDAVLADENTLSLKIVGIIRPTDESVSGSSVGTVGYLSSLMPSLIEKSNDSEVVKAQLADKETDLFTGNKFNSKKFTLEDAPALRAQLASDPNYAMMLPGLTDEQLVSMANAYLTTKATYESNLAKLGYVDMSKPSSISIYPKDFDAKDKISNIISEYNKEQSEEDKISYTDTVAILMNSVTTIVNVVSYVLIAFVAISLVVSSIMIGIITYISVLERTKEIGILRAIGASKRDISRVFNAETIIVGFTAGVIGILITLLLNGVINIILHALTGVATLNAVLPVAGAIILVAISVGLTLIAGLIPSRIASKKDPVIALRTE